MQTTTVALLSYVVLKQNFVMERTIHPREQIKPILIFDTSYS